MKFAVILFIGSILLSGCADTEFYTYSGSGVYLGTGGASRNVNGIDLWVTGTPPRQYRIIGYLTDERLGGPLAMAGRDRGMANQARKAGGDGLLLTDEQSNTMGSYTTGSAMVTGSSNLVTVTGSSMALPIIQRRAKYYVIKYI